jgi:hypothetical protein
MARVLVIPDLHFPAVHPKALAFVKKIRTKYKTTQTVILGDVVDMHYISSHTKNLEDDQNGVIAHKESVKLIKLWHKVIGEADVVIGNHDDRAIRLGASEANIPRVYFKDYSQLYNTPKWKWQNNLVIDNVFYTHGSGASGANPAMNIAKSLLQSTVCGHFHSTMALQWLCGPTNRIFGLTAGCLVDRKHPCMAYGNSYLHKPVLGCSVVIDGHPYMELMDL